MLRFRLPILGLMAVVLLAALGFAALASASLWWYSITFTTALFSLPAAAVLAIVRAGRTRGAAVGYLAFGLTYLVSAFVLFPVIHGLGKRPPLLPKALVDAVQPNTTPLPPETFVSGGFGASLRKAPGRTAQPTDAPVVLEPPGTAGTPFDQAWLKSYGSGRVIDLAVFRGIAHALLGILIGLLGALFGALAARPSDPHQAPQSFSSPQPQV